MQIRNNLLAQYFPELDRFYSACDSETLAIVSWGLTPDTIAAIEFGEFFHLVTANCRRTPQTLRVRKIHSLAIESIGCPMGPASEYETELRYALYQAANVAAARVDLFRLYQASSWKRT